MSVELDSEEKVLGGRKIDGTKFENVGLDLGGAVLKSMDDPKGRMEVKTDSDGKIISYRKEDGTLVENIGIEINHLELTNQGMTDFQQALKDSGFNSGVGDWSDASELSIPEPSCIYINITNDEHNAVWPQAKGTNYHYWLEFWDKAGNYFRKRIVFDAQGQSSMGYVKKNGAIDICNDEWEGDDTFSLRIGKWVPQDGFHLKAAYCDYFKGASFIAYKLSNELAHLHKKWEIFPWQKMLIGNKFGTNPNSEGDMITDSYLQIDTNAMCVPDGIPCVVHLNGEFYGLYIWALKKHRDNYHMDKKNPNHIHLDGSITKEALWDGTLRLSYFEVRNPKNLVYDVPHNGTYKYDADMYQGNIAGNEDGNPNYDTWSAGSYPVNKIVEHNGHLFINSIADNTLEPIYHKKNNGDDAPDFKNKTGCGWINCRNTVKVKEAIIKLSKVMGEIEAAETDEQKKALIETYFDVDNLVDYEIIQAITQDPDGIWGTNWQWTTYDGVKWFVNEYDKDRSWGRPFPGYVNSATSGGLFPSQTYTFSPLHYVSLFYTDKYKQVWTNGVEKGVVTKDNIIGLMDDWMLRFGADYYSREHEKWPESPNDRLPNLNRNYWMFNWLRGEDNYSDDVTYNIGNQVFYCGYGFNCISSNVKGIPPANKYSDGSILGIKDNIYAFAQWVTIKIEHLQELIDEL
jgi:hypothetical protein